jgi:soluble lytic murein transglycosylase
MALGGGVDYGEAKLFLPVSDSSSLHPGGAEKAAFAALARRGWWKVAVALGAVLALLLVLWFWRGDGVYWWQENRPGSAFRQYDGLIEEAARRHGVDPHLLKALVWQESRFATRATGGAGERGLMQVTEIAAEDWVRGEQIETFVPTDLFDPHTNLEVGTWYLARALRRYAAEPDPVPLALAEFNAGASRVNRWLAEREAAATGETEAPTGAAEAFVEAIDFPTTREYIRRIEARRDFYQERAEFVR